MNTDKIYAQQVANEYAPKNAPTVVALRKLDAKAKRPANILAFYLKGIMAVITTWLEQDCQDPPDRILTLLQTCIPRPSTNHSDK